MNTESNPQSNMQKVALTALAGTSIEWYDFFLYGAAAALIFPTAFFGEANSFNRTNSISANFCSRLHRKAYWRNYFWSLW